ncbi:peptidase M20 [Aliifodinibius salipaludis]|uniref:Peptidase M20 n=1 Tax=Fodinibius salipaludis TaxID=2032627 RepID=A0A2A2G959_9BACT|nr:amidohydrolase [Aliifodinibius salipaludis]PAU93544.1 peptidase M20 [Aliifodinibius salipaludis]
MPLNLDTDPHLNELKKLRHKLHAAAEVSGKEQQTADIITDFISATNPDELQTTIGGCGVLATYDSKKAGPHVLIRCELDGLPISDDIEADYRSETDGVGHKCGHDGHMTIVAGVAKLLEKHRPQAGKVTLLFQPAEETGKGAARVMQDSRFKNLAPDYCFALHNLPGVKKHQVVVKNDTFAAASVGLIVRFKGATAHAAHPEEGNSPALAVAQTIQSFSAAPQFHVPLEESAKVTVIHAAVGERAFGTSPGRGTVMATLRTYDDELLAKLKDHCIQIAKGYADTFDLEIDVEWVEEFPATVNNEEAGEIIKTASEKSGLEMHQKKEPFSWSEDFGHFTKEYKGAMFGLGAGKDHPALHAQKYDFPDEILATGISMFMQIINETIDRS